MTAAGRSDPGSGGRWLPLHEPWPSDPPPPEVPPPLVRLFVSAGRLEFRIIGPRPALDLESYAGAGFSGDIWRADCGEVFLGTAGDSRYLEINLGPRGAWWAGEFSGPRVRSAFAVPSPDAIESLDVRSSGSIDGDCWRGEWSAPLDSLTARLGTVLTANLTCVAGAGGSRRFFSLVPLASGRPDFHHPECWPSFDSVAEPDRPPDIL